ncbi:histidinol dehydrogenase, partial [Thermodesulfobacteriota bacterium]
MSQILFKLPRDKEALKTRLEPRKQLFNRELISNIADIFEDVENSGDTAIKDATSKFDNVQIADIRLSEEYIDKCVSSLTPEFRSA